MTITIKSFRMVPVLAVLLCIVSCTQAPPPLLEEPDQLKSSRMVPQDESFDASVLLEEDNIPLPPSELKSPEIETSISSASEKSEANSGIVEMPGFRVQIFVTKEEFEARLVEEEALLQFDESVYLSFDSPNYKIRVGDCKTRAKANKLRQTVVKSGYKDAWVVQCKILSSNR